MNTLYYGDNLEILREYIPDESVDLIYLDPPFNSKRAYNQIFKDKDGKYPPSQIEAFDDTWKWGDETAIVLNELQKSEYPSQLLNTLDAFQKFLGKSDMMAYLVMMTVRLWELRRVLKETGSIYLHCDPTASHYLKIVMDQIFGLKNFRNEVSWKRSSAHNDPSSQFGRIKDTILFYSKSSNNLFNRIFTEYSDEYISAEWKIASSGRSYKVENMLDPRKQMKEYDFMGTKARWRTSFEKMMELWNLPQTDVPNSNGRIKLGKNGKPTKRCRIIFLDEMLGVPLQDIWYDIKYVAGGSNESLGYPTQKPVALLERIIQASSNEGDIVLDPFCGCGTTIAAAEKLGRKWLGIDITILAINLIEKRIKEHFINAKYEVNGIPKDIDSARKMCETREGKFRFERWFITALGGQPFKSEGGADAGIDGFMYFKDMHDNLHRIIVQVKGGHYNRENIAALTSVVEREKASLGLLLVLDDPTKPSISEAAGAGRFQMPDVQRTYPKIQIYTAEEFFAGKRPEIPDVSDTLKKAKREIRESEKKTKLL